MSRFKFLKGDILNIENRFEMYEGEFLDIEKDNTIFANISNCECDAFEDSDVYVYPKSFDSLTNAEDYEIELSDDEYKELKDSLIINYHKYLKTLDSTTPDGGKAH